MGTARCSHIAMRADSGIRRLGVKMAKPQTLGRMDKAYGGARDYQTQQAKRTERVLGKGCGPAGLQETLFSEELMRNTLTPDAENCDRLNCE